jgi:hypothetical protein
MLIRVFQGFRWQHNGATGGIDEKESYRESDPGPRAEKYAILGEKPNGRFSFYPRSMAETANGPHDRGISLPTRRHYL